jgi:hypothetical protein
MKALKRNMLTDAIYHALAVLQRQWHEEHMKRELQALIRGERA